MKAILVLAVLLAVAQCFINDFSCTYTATDGSFYYIGKVGQDSNFWLNATADDGTVYYFQVCQGNSEDDTFVPPCPFNSSVCFNTKDTLVNIGTTSTQLWSDAPSGSENGVESVFGAEGSCQEGGDSIKTVIDYVCEYGSETSTMVVTDQCFTTITVYSEDACPTDGDLVDFDDDMDYSDSEEVIYIPFFSFGALLSMAVVCVCLMCCCCMRRRKCQQRKSIAMKQFSNQAFQPIPTNVVKQSVPMMQPNQVPLPSYNPYVVQQPQQFVYYYPSQFQQQQHPIVKLDQVDQQLVSDEKLAKDLQDQFNRESQV